MIRPGSKIGAGASLALALTLGCGAPSASPDAPLVDVLVNDAIELVGDLGFPTATPVVSVDPGTYNIKVTVADNPGVIAIEADLTFDAGVGYDILAIGPLATIAPLVAIDDSRPIATAAKVRIVHASPTAQDVDIFITAPGADITAETPDPEGGLIERDANGEPTGLLFNHRAMDLLRIHAPQPTVEDMIQNIEFAEKMMSEVVFRFPLERGFFSFSSSLCGAIMRLPFPSFKANSMASDNRLRISLEQTSRSITTSMLCRICRSRFRSDESE